MKTQKVSHRDLIDPLRFDQLNLKITKEMINDSDVKNADMARRYRTPLSTIQRRRTKLERTILKRSHII